RSDSGAPRRVGGRHPHPCLHPHPAHVPRALTPVRLAGSETAIPTPASTRIPLSDPAL
uniref:Uncharacterized protein n=1 Tax=Aegilops tauschii subsp. strangulata TaxID=200361 RepID=A0A453MVI2_AEGTS